MVDFSRKPDEKGKFRKECAEALTQSFNEAVRVLNPSKVIKKHLEQVKKTQTENMLRRGAVRILTQLSTYPAAKEIFEQVAAAKNFQPEKNIMDIVEDSFIDLFKGLAGNIEAQKMLATALLALDYTTRVHRVYPAHAIARTIQI